MIGTFPLRINGFVCAMASGIALFLGGCNSAPQPQVISSDETTDGNIRQAEFATYTPRLPSENGPQPTYDMSITSGLLTLTNGCVGLRRKDGVLVLAFPQGSVSVSTTSDGILFEGMNFRWNDMIEVGGSERGGTAVTNLNVPATCAPDALWVVAPGSMRMHNGSS